MEAVSEILSRAAPGGVSVEAPFQLVNEGLGARPDPTRPVTLRAYLPALDTGAARVAIAEADGRLGHLQAFGLRPIGELQVRPVHEEDWAAAWKQHFPVLRIGRRVVIRPTWRRHRAAPDDVVLALDPGMAFGTGLHPTTRLCLAGIERWADEGLVRGSRALDVGCGSGILAIAAARFGAASILGVDTDPIAVEATRANARRNRVARTVRARARLPAGDRRSVRPGLREPDRLAAGDARRGALRRRSSRATDGPGPAAGCLRAASSSTGSRRCDGRSPRRGFGSSGARPRRSGSRWRRSARRHDAGKGGAPCGGGASWCPGYHLPDRERSAGLARGRLHLLPDRRRQRPRERRLPGRPGRRLPGHQPARADPHPRSCRAPTSPRRRR